jgi:tRNA-binding EMAP/Myf-like protein
VRGVDSSGMICSAYDLGWAEEPDGTPAFVPKSAPLGSPYPDEPFEVRSGACSSCRPVICSSGVSSAARGLAMLGPQVWCCHGQEDPEEAEAAQPAAKAKGGKKKKSKRDVSFAALEDEEDLAAAPAGNVLPRTASCRDDSILWHAMEEPFRDCLGHTSLLSSCQCSCRGASRPATCEWGCCPRRRRHQRSTGGAATASQAKGRQEEEVQAGHRF